MRRYKKRIAPRLSNGDKRDPIAHGLPPHIKRGLALRAYQEMTSVSWLLEKLIIDACHFSVPDYVERKEPKPTVAVEDERRRKRRAG